MPKADRRDEDSDEAPETPLDEPPPPHVEDPPPEPDAKGPYVVAGRRFEPHTSTEEER
jgi:hypothetical protein